MQVRKPEYVVRTLLRVSWSLHIPPHTFNFLGKRIFTEGQWFSAVLNVGDWIEWALDAVIDIINARIDEVQGLITLPGTIIEAIQSSIRTIRDSVAAVYITINELIGGVRSMVNDIWIETNRVIEERIRHVQSTAEAHLAQARLEISASLREHTAAAIAAAIAPFAATINTMSVFRDGIEELFRDPEEWLYHRLESMLDRFW